MLTGKTKLEARFLKAALSSDLKEVSKCLNAGVNVNAYVGGTFTILHIAAERGDMPLGIRLARCPDLNYNIKSLRGNTPLILAVLTRSRKFVKFLLKNGADPDIGDFLEKTPFHHVCRLQAIDLAFDLLKYNANIDAVDVFGNTPLGVALLGVNFVPMAKLLLKHGADTNPMTERSLPLFLGWKTFISYFYIPIYKQISTYISEYREIFRKFKIEIWSQLIVSQTIDNIGITNNI